MSEPPAVRPLIQPWLAAIHPDGQDQRPQSQLQAVWALWVRLPDSDSHQLVWHPCHFQSAPRLHSNILRLPGPRADRRKVIRSADLRIQSQDSQVFQLCKLNSV